MKSVIITGANGFLGGYATRHFAANGWRVFDIAWRLPNPRFAELLRAESPDVCVHCAGRSSVAESFVDQLTHFMAGPPLVLNLLTNLHRHSPLTKFVFLSSAAVYGNPTSNPVSEEHARAPISPYGHLKWACEELCADFVTAYHLRTTNLRIFSAYGPGLRRQVIWDICRQAANQSDLTLQGTGMESRDFLHARDIACALEIVARYAPCHGESYNLASGRETAIAELAERIVQLLAANVRVRFDGVLPPGTPRNWCADMTKLAALGFRPESTWPLKVGLADYVAWFLADRKQAKIA